MMDLTYRIAMEVVSHEAIIRQAYRDSVGTWTWSVGLTSATGHNVERYIDNPQPLQKCLDVFVWALRRYAEQVREEFANYPLTEEQFGAAVSFHWNTGGIRRATWVQKFKAGDIAGARRAFMNWDSPPEIVARRRKERDLFFDGAWSSDGTATEFDVHPNGNPNWGSARKVDIVAELRHAFDVPPADEDTIDHDPQPDAVPGAPTASPSGLPAVLRVLGASAAFIGVAVIAYRYRKHIKAWWRKASWWQRIAGVSGAIVGLVALWNWTF